MESAEEKIKYLEKEELAHFLKTTQSEGLEMDVKLPFHFRVKNRRITSLKWSDFNDKKGTLRVIKTLYNPNNNFEGYQLLTPKQKDRPNN